MWVYYCIHCVLNKLTKSIKHFVYSFQDAPVIAAATTANSQKLTAVQTHAAKKYTAALA